MQNNTKLFFSFGFALVLAAVFAGFYSPESGAQSSNRARLFNLAETPHARAENEKYSPASIRESEIAFQDNAFESRNSARLSFPLFDGKTFEAIRLESEGLEARGADDFTWPSQAIKRRMRNSTSIARAVW